MKAKSPSKKISSSAEGTSASRAMKTTKTAASVEAFLASIDPKVQEDCRKVDGWMQIATGLAGVMYGKSIIGYGTSTIRYADGREAPWMKIGFSPRTQSLALYGLLSATSSSKLLAKLGKYSTGKGCLYVKRLADVDEETLQALIQAAANA